MCITGVVGATNLPVPLLSTGSEEILMAEDSSLSEISLRAPMSGAAVRGAVLVALCWYQASANHRALR